jgi:ferrous iron transport protein A
MFSLDSLLPGQRGVIAALSGDDPVTVRLLEMGLLPGEEVELLGVAPLGDPLAILVRGARLAIRRRDASRVQLRETTRPRADETFVPMGR